MPYAETFNALVQPGKIALAHAREIQKLGLLPLDQGVGYAQGPQRGATGLGQADIAPGWPVCGGFLWPKKARWEKGLLQMAPRDAVRDGHSVLLVGYRDDQALPGGGEFLIRNSAEPSRDGMMSYEYILAYMNDAVWIDRAEGSRAATGPDAAYQDVLANLTAPPSGRNRRISSNEQPRWNDANLDMTWLQPGQVLELPVLEGPGVITHVWFTSHAGWANELNWRSACGSTGTAATSRAWRRPWATSSPSAKASRPLSRACRCRSRRPAPVLVTGECRLPDRRES